MATRKKMTEAEYHQHVGQYNGLCLCCGEIRGGDTEPDAEKYPCRYCKRNCVMGMENAMMNEYLDIVDSEEDGQEEDPLPSGQ